MTERTTVFVSGKVYWAKIIGAPKPNYEGDGREWTYEFEPDDTTFLKDAKLLDRLKEPKGKDAEGREPYLTLKKPEFDREGKANEPLRIYTADNEAWDDRLLGNGTAVDVKLSIVDWGKGKKKSIYTTAIRVTDLVPYVSNEFGAMDEQSPKKNTKPKTRAKAPVAELDDLDDEAPF